VTSMQCSRIAAATIRPSRPGSWQRPRSAWARCRRAPASRCRGRNPAAHDWSRRRSGRRHCGVTGRAARAAGAAASSAAGCPPPPGCSSTPALRHPARAGADAGKSPAVRRGGPRLPGCGSRTGRCPGHVTLGGISGRPSGTVIRLGRHHPLRLDGIHRMKHQPRCHKIAHSREEHHAGQTDRTGITRPDITLPPVRDHSCEMVTVCARTPAPTARRSVRMRASSCPAAAGAPTRRASRRGR
jgi:hypothetical protein